MEKPNFLPDSPSFVDLCTLHQHAMRYYRLWIYACNTVLAIATLVFTIFAVSVCVDPRLTLLPGVEFYQPTFIYAYVALILQCGVIQTIGCLGALRLNQRLLNTYWTLLLLLMIGDIVVGLVWAIRLDRIKSNLKPGLKLRLTSSYGFDPDFTSLWDWVQTQEICCGIESPDDFRFNESLSQTYGSGDISDNVAPHRLPSSCCTFTKLDHHQVEEEFNGPNSNFPRQHHSIPPAGGAGSRDYVSAEVNKRHSHQHSGTVLKRRSPRAVNVSSIPSVAQFLRTRPKLLPPPSSSVMTVTKTDNLKKGPLHPQHKVGPTLDPVMMMRSDEVSIFCELPPNLQPIPTESSLYPSSPPVTIATPRDYKIHLNRHGCAEKLLVWIDHVTDVMFVLGFCIIVFLKGCFLAILRYEIKEMIQKIRLLNGDEPSRSVMNELIGLTAIYDTTTSPDDIELELQNIPAPTTAVGPTSSHSISEASSDQATSKPAKKGYPPFGNYLNSNNMMYRLQRQMSQQAQAQEEVEEDADSCSALLQLTQRRSRSGSASEKRTNSTRRTNSVAVPIPRNGNNNMTTATALVGASSVTGAAPVASAVTTATVVS